MIYSDSFIQYLKDNLGEPIKITSKNIVTRCPWCEYGQTKKHYHLYISTVSPIFHCFHAACSKGGFISQLCEKIEGKDTSAQYVDKTKVQEYIKHKTDLTQTKAQVVNIQLPPLNTASFRYKEMYLQKRFRFVNNVIPNMRGLVYDISAFIEMNNVVLTEAQLRIRDYLHSNFIGFLTEHKSVLSLRNVDDSATFSYYKMKLFDTNFVDYYKIDGYDKSSNRVILGEGIFDIYSEHIFDSLNLRESSNMYACALSGGSYGTILNSLAFYEQIFRPDVVILSDRDMPLQKYKQLKRFSVLMNSLTIYYNRTGKDFNVTPIVPERFVL